jgi:AcrR family transcriptional regulator
MQKATGGDRTDGRRARSERTREAIVDTLLELLEAGEIQPSTERLADFAGVSRRVVFHHFRDREELLQTAAARQMARILPALPPLPTTGTLEARLDGFMATRKHLLERITPVRRVALLLEPSSPTIAENLRAVRARHRAEVEAVFAPEIEACPPGERAAFAAALTAASGFPFWNALTYDQKLPAPQAARAMRFAIEGVLARGAAAPKKTAAKRAQ